LKYLRSAQHLGLQHVSFVSLFVVAGNIFGVRLTLKCVSFLFFEQQYMKYLLALPQSPVSTTAKNTPNHDLDCAGQPITTPSPLAAKNTHSSVQFKTRLYLHTQRRKRTNTYRREKEKMMLA
jgi:hypothetical protein